MPRDTHRNTARSARASRNITLFTVHEFLRSRVEDARFAEWIHSSKDAILSLYSVSDAAHEAMLAEALFAESSPYTKEATILWGRRRCTVLARVKLRSKGLIPSDELDTAEIAKTPRGVYRAILTDYIWECITNDLAEWGEANHLRVARGLRVSPNDLGVLKKGSVSNRNRGRLSFRYTGQQVALTVSISQKVKIRAAGA